MEQEQCEAGFCHATQYNVSLAECKAAATANTWSTPWDNPNQATATGYRYGTFPCTSTVYDWRDGTLWRPNPDPNRNPNPDPNQNSNPNPNLLQL